MFFKKENNVNCNTTQSEQTKVYHMARYITLILTKSYTMVILANLEKYQNCIDNNDYPGKVGKSGASNLIKV